MDYDPMYFMSTQKEREKYLKPKNAAYKQTIKIGSYKLYNMHDVLYQWFYYFASESVTPLMRSTKAHNQYLRLH